MLASPTIVAVALVASVCVKTFSMMARIWLPIELVALIHIDIAVRAHVSFSTSAYVGIWSVRQRGAVGTVSARVGCTVVPFSAVSPLPSSWAGAGVAAQGGHVAGAPMLAGRAVAHIGHWISPP